MKSHDNWLDFIKPKQLRTYRVWIVRFSTANGLNECGFFWRFWLLFSWINLVCVRVETFALFYWLIFCSHCDKERGKNSGDSTKSTAFFNWMAFRQFHALSAPKTIISRRRFRRLWCCCASNAKTYNVLCVVWTMNNLPFLHTAEK